MLLDEKSTQQCTKRSTQRERKQSVGATMCFIIARTLLKRDDLNLNHQLCDLLSIYVVCVCVPAQNTHQLTDLVVNSGLDAKKFLF